MPRVKPIGSPAMKAKQEVSMARRDEVARAKSILAELGKLKAVASIKLEVCSDAQFSDLLGIGWRHYRLIKENPLKLTLDDIRSIQALAKVLGESVKLGVEA